jgi:tetratricopeptide (TPR) repeat protein
MVTLKTENRMRSVAWLLAVALVVTLSTGVHAAELSKVDKTIQSFVESLKSNDSLSDAQREKILRIVADLRASEFAKGATITEGLREVYPEFASALTLLADEDLKKSIPALQKLAASKDEFLAAEASFFLARAHMFGEQFEEALVVLNVVLQSDKSLNNGHALFLRGVTESQLLMRKQAIATLGKYLKDYPNAPERMRVGAWRHKMLLEQIDAGSISDVANMMDFSRRKLALDDTGKKTRKVQDDIVAMLGKLIEEAEKKECEACKNCEGEGKPGEGKGSGSGQGQGMGGNTGGNSSGNSIAARKRIGGPRSPWGDLRKKERMEKTFAALKAKFPARYKQLIQQYYKSFQEDEE